MAFADTYHHQVVQSRRDRARRALFWSRVTGLALMVTVAVTLRSEPDLRNALVLAAMDGVSNLRGTDAPKIDAPGPVAQRQLADRVKVNRFGSDTGAGRERTDVRDGQQIAQDVGQQLTNFTVGQ